MLEAQSEEVVGRAQGNPASKPECAGGDCVSGRRNPAHVAAGVRRSRFGPMASLTWFGARKSRCGRFRILTHDRMQSGMRFWTVCTGAWGGWANPGPRRYVAWGWRLPTFDLCRGAKVFYLHRQESGSSREINRDAISFYFVQVRPAMTLRLAFVCTVQDQHHNPVGDLVSMSFADSVHRADGHHLLPIQPVLERNRSSGAAGDLRCQDDSTRDFHSRAPG